ncbi:MAG TPA: ABC transporter ATP-binding protein [Anaerolineales bacterium]|jgi:ABC-type polysaccharide/polyol phosphate transport system ATPase subunit
MSNNGPIHDGQDDDLVIALKSISVRFRVPTETVSTLKERGIRLLRGKSIGYREFLALQDIDLEIQRGEVLGIIGRNGAGKSTLLKVISRILRPTRGRAWVRGKVAPLIELGAGFHPELTGRENVYLNGAILGFSEAEMDEKFDRIVAFAELGDFIHSPLRTYSSGMKMRLGFAVATDVNPDILIIDEILSVGDKDFQVKCTQRMSRFRDEGTTILFVSHSLGTIKELCTRAIWINGGRIEADSTPEFAVDSYNQFQSIAQ